MSTKRPEDAAQRCAVDWSVMMGPAARQNNKVTHICPPSPVVQSQLRQRVGGTSSERRIPIGRRIHTHAVIGEAAVTQERL
ncbi:unnamed protein product [Merluccius merluccius]